MCGSQVLWPVLLVCTGLFFIPYTVNTIVGPVTVYAIQNQKVRFSINAYFLFFNTNLTTCFITNGFAL